MPKGVPSTPKLDPLLAALIEKLPAGGSEWSTEDRQSWISMMEMAFNVVYRREADYVAIDPRIAEMMNKPFPPKPADHAFYIDRENYARKAGGERIHAFEVDGTVYDQRGEGDLGAIIWADGSTGVLGKVLDIKPA
jgi:hypothetical protein